MTLVREGAYECNSRHLVTFKGIAMIIEVLRELDAKQTSQLWDKAQKMKL